MQAKYAEPHFKLQPLFKKRKQHEDESDSEFETRMQNKKRNEYRRWRFSLLCQKNCQFLKQNEFQKTQGKKFWTTSVKKTPNRVFQIQSFCASSGSDFEETIPSPRVLPSKKFECGISEELRVSSASNQWTPRQSQLVRQSKTDNQR